MAKSLLKTVHSPNGRQRAEFFRDTDGAYRFGVLQFYDADPDNPFEEPPGWWSPIWQSGIYASLDEAERNLTDEGWPIVTSSDERPKIVTRGGRET